MCVCVCVRVRSHTLASELCVCVCVYTNRRPPSFNFFSKRCVRGAWTFYPATFYRVWIFFLFDLGKIKDPKLAPFGVDLSLILGSNPHLGRPGLAR